MSDERTSGEEQAIYLPFLTLYTINFIAWGLFVPYFNFFLVGSGYSKSVVTWSFSLYPLMTMVAPPLLGNLVDRRFSRRSTLRVLFFSAGLVFLLFFLNPPVWALFLIMALFALAYSPILSMSDAMTLRTVRPSYGIVRSAGTMAFLIISFAGGLAQRWLDLSTILWGIPVFMWIAALWMRWVPDAGVVDKGGRSVKWGAVWRSVRARGMVPFFLFGLFHWMSLSPYHSLFSVYLDEMAREQGHADPGVLVGLAWAASTLTEFLFFLFSNRLLRQFGVRLLAWSVVLASLVRWAVYAMAAPVWLILVGQGLHCFVFAAFYILSTRLVAAEAPASLRNSYQTLWAGTVMGMGGFLGGLATGLLADLIAIEALYWFAVGCSLVSVVPLGWFLRGHQVDTEQLINGPPPVDVDDQLGHEEERP